MRRAIRCSVLFFASLCGLAVTLHAGMFDVFKFASKGGPKEGPGQGMIGAMTIDIPTNLGEMIHTSILDNVSNMVEDNDEKEKIKDAQTKQIQEAIGTSSTGLRVEEYKWTADPMALAVRQNLITTLKADANAQAYTPFLAYFNAVQSHEARTQVFAQRLNTLIKTNNTAALNWQQRTRLGAEIGLYEAQKTLAEMEIRENYNRALLSHQSDRLTEAVAERDRLQAQREAAALAE